MQGQAEERDDGAGNDAGPPSVTFASGGLSWTRVRLPASLSRIAKLLYAFGAVMAVVNAVTASEYMLMAAIAATVSMAAWPMFIVSYIVSLTQTSFRGSVEVSADELVIVTPDMKRKAIPRAKIVGALVVERQMFGGFTPTVEIELKSGDVLTARLAEPRSAHAIVRALGFGAGGKRLHASLAKPTRRLWHPVFGAGAWMIALTFSTQTGWEYSSMKVQVAYAVYPLVALLLYAGMKRLFRAPAVTVGDDGVLVKARLGQQFIPRSDIARVTAAEGMSLVIERRTGSRTVVGGQLMDPARRTALAQAIDQRVGASAATADRLVHYERGGRALSAWREHLARAMNESSYRQTAATVDEAAAVLRSAEASPEQRVGAALALRVAGQPRERIRVAAEGAVDERVRDALEAVAEADDDVVIEKALRRLG